MNLTWMGIIIIKITIKSTCEMTFNFRSCLQLWLMNSTLKLLFFWLDNKSWHTWFRILFKRGDLPSFGWIQVRFPRICCLDMDLVNSICNYVLLWHQGMSLYTSHLFMLLSLCHLWIIWYTWWNIKIDKKFNLNLPFQSYFWRAVFGRHFLQLTQHWHSPNPLY